MKTTLRTILTTYKLHGFLILMGALLWLMYAGFLTYTFLYNNHDVGNNLQFSSFLIQGGMLFFAILGWRLARKTMDQTSVVFIIKKELWKIHLLNVLCLLATSFFFVSLPALGFQLYYMSFEGGGSFAKESLLFLLNYWLIPYLLMGFIGYLFGMNSKNKVVFVLLLGVWVILSPSNLHFIATLMDNTKLESAADLFRNLNLGVYDMNTPYDPFYGFEFEWGKKIILIYFLSLLLLLSTRTSNRGMNRLLLLTTSILILIPGFIPTSSTFSALNDPEKLTEDYLYYDDPPHMNDNRLFSYDIKTMDVVLEDKGEEGVVVETTMNLANIKERNISLILYRGYKVSDVHVAGESIPFERSGDYVEVDLPEKISEGPTTLTLHYSGIGSSSHPSLNNYLYLPANFAWLPNNQNTASMYEVNGEFLTSDLTPKTEIDYTLEYKGGGELIYTNLKKIDDEKYLGSSKGLTVISGDFTSARFGPSGKEILYPSSWFTHKSEMNDFLDTFNTQLKEYSQMVGEEFNMPDHVIFIPNMGGNDVFTHTKTTKHDDHIILPIDPVNAAGYSEMQKMLPYQVPWVDQKHNETAGEKSFKDWYIYTVVVGWYMSNGIVEEENLQKTHLLRIIGPITDHEDLWERMIALDKGDVSPDLIRAWRSILLDDDERNWEQVERLLGSSP
ncbi:UNVERIFIED_CONTAM: hypothetical protein N8J90_18880 [Halobacillus marinus]